MCLFVHKRHNDVTSLLETPQHRPSYPLSGGTLELHEKFLQIGLHKTPTIANSTVSFGDAVMEIDIAQPAPQACSDYQTLENQLHVQ